MPVASSIAAGAIIAGTAASVYGNIKANNAQASADKANSMFYSEQAQFAQLATERELSIYQDQSAEFFGQQESSISKGGVALTGSPLLALADTKYRAAREADAIRIDGAAKVREANLKAGMSASQANAVGSTKNNLLQGAGTSLTGLATAYTLASKGSASNASRTASPAINGGFSGSEGFGNGGVA